METGQLSPFLKQLSQAGISQTPASLLGTRNDAWEFFQAKGLPSTKDEDWKYTSLVHLDRQNYALARSAGPVPKASALEPYLLPGSEVLRLTFVDGIFQAELSSNKLDTAGIEIRSLASALENKSLLEKANSFFSRGQKHTEDSLHALNTAFFSDGAYIHVQARAHIVRPIQLLFVTSERQGQSVIPVRNLIHVEEAAEVKIVETYVSLGLTEHCTSAVTEVYCEKNSLIDITKVQLESEKAYHLSTLHLVQESGSHFAAHAFNFGGALSRNEIHPLLDGENIESILNGLTVLRGEQHVDNTTVINHAKPNSFSREMYKGIYADKSRGVFSGTIIVAKDAQKTNAIQSNQTLLLSEEASIDTRPQLKIYADDVKCTHGATIGQLDENGLFYLRSRGIEKNEARNLLIHAFASDIIQHVPLPELRDQLENWLMERLGKIV